MARARTPIGGSLGVPRAPAPASQSLFQSPPPKDGTLEIREDGTVVWRTHNVSEAEILIYRAGSVPASAIVPPAGDFQGPRYAQGPLFLYQLYDHSSGFRGQLLDAKQSPTGIPIPGQGPISGFWVLDPDGSFSWLTAGVERAQLYLTLGDQAEDLWDSQDGLSGAPFTGHLLINQLIFYVRVRVRIVGTIGSEVHALRDDTFGPLGDPPEQNYFALRPRAEWRLTGGGLGYVLPR